MEKEKGASIIITEDQEGKIWIKANNKSNFVNYMSQGAIHEIKQGGYNLFNLLAYTISIVLKECPESQIKLMSIAREVSTEINKFDEKSLKS